MDASHIIVWLSWGFLLITLIYLGVVRRPREPKPPIWAERIASSIEKEPPWVKPLASAIEKHAETVSKEPKEPAWVKPFSSAIKDLAEAIKSAYSGQHQGPNPGPSTTGAAEGDQPERPRTS